MVRHKNYRYTKDLGSVERAIIDLEIERSKLNREKSMLVLNKALLLYFVFLFTGIVGFVNGYIDAARFNILIAMGLAVLIVGIWPYINTMRNEEGHLNMMIDKLKHHKR